MTIKEIREMLILMDKFVDEEPLNIVSMNEEAISDEEKNHIKISHRAMKREKNKFLLERFQYKQSSF